MTRLIKNKKGFTLIELLAVIVLLAIVGVVGANLIITRLNKGKVDTFVNDYQDIVKEVSAAQIEGMNDCDDNADTGKCSDSEQIDYASSDISLTISQADDMKTTITATAKGTFAKIDLSKYYCDSDATSCDTGKKKLPKNSKMSGKTTIIGIFK